MSNLADLFLEYNSVLLPQWYQPNIPQNVDNFWTPRVETESKEENDSKSESSEIEDTDEWGFRGGYFSSPKTEEQFKIPSLSTPSLISTPSESTPVVSKNEWTKAMIAAYKKIGLPNNAIKNLLAKNALESGWGKSALGKYNYGNITTGAGYKGKYIIGKDKDGKGNPISQKFRSYNSLDEYVLDELSLLKRRYDFDPNDSFTTFISKLLGRNKSKYKYAADPNYLVRALSVYNSIK